MNKNRIAHQRKIALFDTVPQRQLKYSNVESNINYYTVNA